MKRMIDWYRVKRTVLQVASGSAIGTIAAIVAYISGLPDISPVIVISISFIGTVLTALCMNINKQTKEQDCNGDAEDVEQ